ncbi:MAG: NADPH-dependent F420 reductase [bacterium]
MTTIGFIGSGSIGSTLARLAIGSGHDVVLSNSRGPETLSDLVDQLGPQAAADAAPGAAERGDVVVVTIPVKAIGQVPVEPLAGKVVIDTNNYYPQRDGNIAALDNDETTSSELLAAHLPGAHVVKAFNHIYAADLATDGSPAGTPGRRALAIAGDDPAAKKTVAQLLDGFGFDAVDVGPLAEGRRYQPDTAPYGPRQDADELRKALGV